MSTFVRSPGLPLPCRGKTPSYRHVHRQPAASSLRSARCGCKHARLVCGRRRPAIVRHTTRQEHAASRRCFLPAGVLRKAAVRKILWSHGSLPAEEYLGFGPAVRATAWSLVHRLVPGRLACSRPSVVRAVPKSRAATKVSGCALAFALLLEGAKALADPRRVDFHSSSAASIGAAGPGRPTPPDTRALGSVAAQTPGTRRR